LITEDFCARGLFTGFLQQYPAEHRPSGRSRSQHLSWPPV